MPNLKCYVYSCKHNHCAHCQRSIVNVSNNAYCNDYVRKEKVEEDDMFDYEFSYDHGMGLKNDEHRISCNNQSCLHNENGLCEEPFIRFDKTDIGAHCAQVKNKR